MSIIVTWASQKPLAVILLISFAVRLVNIDSPIIGAHSWRQADTAAMARNFYENGFKLFYPEVDWGGDTPGYIESEFPIYPFLTSLLYYLFGVSEVLARFLTVLGSLVGIYFLFRLVRDICGEKEALWSTSFFAFLPLQIFYSRAVMPDMFMLSSTIAGVYFFNEWIQRSESRSLLLSGMFISLAGLLKLTSLYIGLPLLFLAWTKYRTATLSQKALWAYALGVILPIILWYYHAHSILQGGGLTVGIWEYGSDKWGNWSLVFSFDFWNRIIFQSLAERHFTWAGFIILLIGIFLQRGSLKERVIDFWLVGVLVYFFIVGKGNYVHEYYQLPFMIPGTIYMGKVYGRYLSLSGRKLIRLSLVLALLIMGTLGVWRYLTYMKFENKETSIEYALASSLNQKTDQAALVGLMARNDPTVLYLANRKGWNLFVADITNGRADSLVQHGLSYIVGADRYTTREERAILDSALAGYNKDGEEGRFFIYSLKK